MINIVATGINKNDKTKLEITIYISKPYWTIQGEEAACDVKISPLYENISPIHGIVPFQALKLAIDLLDNLIGTISNKYDLTYH